MIKAKTTSPSQPLQRNKCDIILCFGITTVPQLKSGKSRTAEYHPLIAMTTVITITMRTIQSGKIRVSANIYLLYINFLLYCYHLLLGRSQEERDGGKTHCLAILEIRKIAIRSEIYDKAAEDQKSWFLAALLPVMLGS